LAWWLVPGHNTDPTELKATRPFAAAAPAESKERIGVFSLPTGIESIVPLEAQNSLLVLGTDSGMKRLEPILDFLDKPLKQVEVEAYLVEVSAENYEELGLALTEPNPAKANSKPAVSLGFVRGNFLGQLEKLKKQNKARVISTPRVTTFNNQAAAIATTYSQPAPLGLKNEKGHYTELLDKNNLGLSLGRQFKLAVTPTINNDETITISINPSMTLVLTSESSSEPLVLRNLESVQSVANVRDGDTLALTGLTTQMLPTADAAKQTPSSLVLFVTPRIIRRLGDAEAKAVSLTR
jgi:type II secretory pathway component GspD/PulD (secretin)